MLVALRLLLKLSDNMDLVGEMRNGRNMVNCVKIIRPDVLVMDVRMSELDGISATSQIVELAVGTRVILIPSQRGNSIAMQAIEAGARGFVPKEELAAFLLLAIETVHCRHCFIRRRIWIEELGQAGLCADAHPASCCLCALDHAAKIRGIRRGRLRPDGCTQDGHRCDQRHPAWRSRHFALPESG